MSPGRNEPVAETLVQPQDAGVLLCVSRIDRGEALVGGPADGRKLGKPRKAAAAKLGQGAGELIRPEPRRLVDLEERQSGGAVCRAHAVAPPPPPLREFQR